MELKEKSLYESKFLCISKSKTDDVSKKIYQKKILEIFENERKYINFEITTYEFKDPKFNTVNSTIHLYRKINFNPSIPIPNETEEQKKKRLELDEKLKKNDPEDVKKKFCSLNKNEQFKNISFIEQIGHFYEKTHYFIKYISNKQLDNGGYDTRIVEISRCGFNMGEILKNIGYEKKEYHPLNGFCYQYKYFPIICFYIKFSGDPHIFLQVNGYYTENKREEITAELDKIKEQLSEIFYIK
jgi:hypothetical protein